MSKLGNGDPLKQALWDASGHHVRKWVFTSPSVDENGIAHDFSAEGTMYYIGENWEAAAVKVGGCGLPGHVL